MIHKPSTENTNCKTPWYIQGKINLLLLKVSIIGIPNSYGFLTSLL